MPASILPLPPPSARVADCPECDRTMSLSPTAGAWVSDTHVQCPACGHRAHGAHLLNVRAMSKADAIATLKELGPSVRNGQATVEQTASFDEAQCFMDGLGRAERATVRTVMDLPVAKGMWEADARDMGW